MLNNHKIIKLAEIQELNTSNRANQIPKSKGHKYYYLQLTIQKGVRT